MIDQLKIFVMILVFQIFSFIPHFVFISSIQMIQCLQITVPSFTFTSSYPLSQTNTVFPHSGSWSVNALSRNTASDKVGPTWSQGTTRSITLWASLWVSLATPVNSLCLQMSLNFSSLKSLSPATKEGSFKNLASDRSAVSLEPPTCTEVKSFPLALPCVEGSNFENNSLTWAADLLLNMCKYNVVIWKSCFPQILLLRIALLMWTETLTSEAKINSCLGEYSLGAQQKMRSQHFVFPCCVSTAQDHIGAKQLFSNISLMKDWHLTWRISTDRFFSFHPI